MGIKPKKLRRDLYLNNFKEKPCMAAYAFTGDIYAFRKSKLVLRDLLFKIVINQDVN
jgi:hypothetical protein